MRNIRLSDGTVYPVDRCGANDGTLYIRVTGDYSLLDLVEKFDRAENVQRIEHWFEGTETDHVWFDGYMDLMAAQSMNEGIMLTLRRG